MMSSSYTSLHAVRRFMELFAEKSKSSLNGHIDDFYHDVLNLNFSQENPLNNSELLSSTVEENPPENIHEIHSQSQIIHTDPIIILTESELSPKPLIKKVKVNPRLSKLNRIKEKIEKSTSKSPIELTTKNEFCEESRERYAWQIREITLKKIELKNKLRQLDFELKQEKEKQHQKHSFISYESCHEPMNESLPNPEGENLLSKLTNPSMISNKPSSFIFSRIKSKSDAQFNLPRQFLKEKEAIYSPEKHEAAFKLISKIHNEKIKKHEKILSDMKLKQEKEIETLKKLKELKKLENEKKIVRQKVLLAPKSTNELKSYLSQTDRATINKVSSKITSELEMKKGQKLIRPDVKQRMLYKISAESIEEEKDEKPMTIHSHQIPSQSLPTLINELENEFLSY